MASILSGNSLPQMQNGQQAQQDPMAALNSLVDQVLSSADPNQTFTQMVNSIQGGQNALNLIQQYGNGDPKTAFMNFAAQNGKNVLAQQILQRMNLS